MKTSGLRATIVWIAIWLVFPSAALASDYGRLETYFRTVELGIGIVCGAITVGVFRFRAKRPLGFSIIAYFVLFTIAWFMVACISVELLGGGMFLLR